MPLLQLLDAELAYGLHPLLDRAALALEAGERIGLIGRNGTGKSSLLAVIAGVLSLDDGEVQRADGTLFCCTSAALRAASRSARAWLIRNW